MSSWAEVGSQLDVCKSGSGLALLVDLHYQLCVDWHENLFSRPTLVGR